MLLYSVSWTYDKNLTKGKGRVSTSEHFFSFSVICRNSSDAVKCLNYHFNFVFRPSSGITIDDGSITLKRSIVDSRGFTAKYMMMDGLREPLELSDLKSNFVRLNKIFGYERSTL